MEEKEEICCSAEFYGKIDPDYDYDFSLYKKNQMNNIEPFELDIAPILESNYNDFHYLCPECCFFPYIIFKNKDYIYYTCGCKNRKNLKLKIEDLFAQKNKFMIFNKNENIIGLKCINKNRFFKFKYYCTDCHINLCKKCCERHLNEKHILIIFDFNNNDIYVKANKIIDYFNSSLKNINQSEIKSDYNNNLDDLIDLSFDKKINIENKSNMDEIPNNQYYFNELIKIIINDYLNCPNYSHFFNIQNIFRFFKNQDT